MLEPLHFVVALGLAIGLWAAYGKLRALKRPPLWRVKNYGQACQVCEEKPATFHERGMKVCNDCSELLP